MSLSIFQIEDWSPNILSMIKVWFQVLIKTFFAKKSYDMIVLEYGIDRPREMEFLIWINKPHIWVFTAIDAVHSEQFGSPAEIAHEEVKMLQNTREIGFLNLDDTYARQLREQLEIDKFSYAASGEWATDISFANEAMQKIQKNKKSDFRVTFDLSIKSQTARATTNLVGKPNYAYFGVAVAIAQICVWRFEQRELDLKQFLQEEFVFALQAGRASIFAGKEESLILDSTYNASPLSMRKMIDTTLRIKRSLGEERKVFLVLGDMRELGDLTEQEHRSLAGCVHQSADQVMLLGQYMSKYMLDELEKSGYPQEKVKVWSSTMEVWTWVCDFLKASDEKWIVLFKGSQNTIFLEEAVKLVLEHAADAKLLTRQGAWWMAKKGISDS